MNKDDKASVGKNDKPETKANRFVQPSTSWYGQQKQVWKGLQREIVRLQQHAMLKVANVIRKNMNNKKSDLYVSIRSPSQWQLSGSCLPLLRPVVYISANASSWHTNQNQVRWKFEISQSWKQSKKQKLSTDFFKPKEKSVPEKSE